MRICSVDGCGLKHYGRGFCSKHHKRWEAHGDPNVDNRAKRTPLADRFWKKVNKTETCWLWTGSLNQSGYGRINPGGGGSQPVETHRVSWEMAHGPIPDKAFVLHKCDVRNCVNPDHLFLGDNLANARDMIAKDRCQLRSGGSGEFSAYRKMTWGQVLCIRDKYAEGMKQSDIAAEYGLTQSGVSKIVRMKVWKDEGSPPGRISSQAQN